jgi:hypothetical protein
LHFQIRSGIVGTTETEGTDMIEITDDQPMIEILVQYTRGDDVLRVKRLYTQDEWNEFTKWGIDSAFEHAAEKCAEKVTERMDLYY